VALSGKRLGGELADALFVLDDDDAGDRNP
jgi:hypothetical protein